MVLFSIRSVLFDSVDSTAIVFDLPAYPKLTGIFRSQETNLSLCNSGMTLYFTDPLEKTLEATQSINLPPDVVPIMSIKQVHTTKLGPPYSVCRLVLTNHKGLHYVYFVQKVSAKKYR